MRNSGYGPVFSRHSENGGSRALSSALPARKTVASAACLSGFGGGRGTAGDGHGMPCPYELVMAQGTSLVDALKAAEELVEFVGGVEVGF